MRHGTGQTAARVIRAIGVAAAAACLVAVGGAGPARAAAPDALGFVLYNGAAVVPSGTFPAGASVLAVIPGRYRVTFPGMAARGGVAHVTAVNPVAHWCQLDGWGASGADQVVGVSCYRPGGVLDASGFSLSFESSSGAVLPGPGRFGYADVTPGGALISQYNSAGAANSVVHGAVGQYVVTMPGLATPGPVDGSVQATAVSPNVGARCKVGRWVSSPAGQRVLVRCFNPGGALADSRFTLSYQYQRSLYAAAAPPRFFGYLWNAPPVGPASTNFDSITGPGTVTLLPAGVGLSLVTFPRLSGLPDDVQVTAVGGGSEFCGLLTNWAHIGPDTVVRDVNCFTNAGARIDTGFTVSANSRV